MFNSFQNSIFGPLEKTAGHFVLENEIKSHVCDVPDFPKLGIVYKDITPLLASPEVCAQAVDYNFSHFFSTQIHAIAGLESRGFLLGVMLAQRFGLPFIPIRKKGKLPRKTVRQQYKLEYGEAEIEMHEDAVSKGQRVLIHDDVLATGGTAAAAAQLIEKCGGEVAGFSFIIELKFLNGREKIEKYTNQILSLATY